MNLICIELDLGMEFMKSFAKGKFNQLRERK